MISKQYFDDGYGATLNRFNQVIEYDITPDSVLVRECGLVICIQPI